MSTPVKGALLRKGIEMRRTIGGNAQDRRRTRRAASRRQHNGLSDQDVRDIQTMIAAASGSSGLPLSDRGVAWDAAAADKAVRDWAGADDAPNEKYGQAFLVQDGDGMDFGDYHLPFATVIDGKLTAVWRGVTAAAAALQGSRGASVEGGDAAKPKIEAYYSAARRKYGDDSIEVPWKSSSEQSAATAVETLKESARSLLLGDDGEHPSTAASAEADATESASRDTAPHSSKTPRASLAGKQRTRETWRDTEPTDATPEASSPSDSTSTESLPRSTTTSSTGNTGGAPSADLRSQTVEESTSTSITTTETAASEDSSVTAATPDSASSEKTLSDFERLLDTSPDDALTAHRLAYAEMSGGAAYAQRLAFWIEEFNAEAATAEIAEMIVAELGGRPSKGTKKDKRLKDNPVHNDNDNESDDKSQDDDMALDPELAALAAIEEFAASVKCGCGHAFSEHSGAGGTCGHEDGRGTCRCGEFAYPDSDVAALAAAIVTARPDLAGFEAEVARIAERALLALEAAAGDVAWGPEDGFVDLLCDVNETLRSAGSDESLMGPRAVDAGVKLDKVLICDGDDYFVAPITIDGQGEPVVSDRADWISVEGGAYLESPDDDKDEMAVRPMAMQMRFALSDVKLTAASVEVPEAVEVIPEASDEITPPTANANGEIPWEATFVPEGVLTEDGRAFAPGSVILPPDEQARQLPLSLMGLIETSSEGGHDRAKVAGRIDNMWRDEESGKVKASGVFSNEEWGSMIARMVESKELTGLSVDIAPLAYEHVTRADWFDENGKWTAVQDEDGEWTPASGVATPEPESLEEWLNADLVLAITKAVIGMATVCPFPAFGEAEIALTASGLPRTYTGPLDLKFDCGCTPVEVAYESPEDEEEEKPALTASAAGLAPVSPPVEWFADPEFSEVTAMTVTEDGRIFGHAWQWDTCHLSFDRECVTAPKSETNYAYYMLGEIECDDGERLSVGKITLDTGHAGTRLSRADATAHYDNTGTVAAHVQFGEDEFGGWFAGAISPELSEEKVRLLRGATVSGDWRGVDGNLELVGLLAVNVPGFPVPRSLQASVVVVDDEPVTMAMVAAGIVTEGLEADILALVNEVAVPAEA